MALNFSSKYTSSSFRAFARTSRTPMRCDPQQGRDCGSAKPSEKGSMPMEVEVLPALQFKGISKLLDATPHDHSALALYTPEMTLPMGEHEISPMRAGNETVQRHLFPEKTALGKTAQPHLQKAPP